MTRDVARSDSFMEAENKKFVDDELFKIAVSDLKFME